MIFENQGGKVPFPLPIFADEQSLALNTPLAKISQPGWELSRVEAEWIFRNNVKNVV